jgi:predicted PolB exonuclease-like 3'-5' exonuclease
MCSRRILSQAKVRLHELCRVMGLAGKPDHIDGSEVDKYFREGRIQVIADYCESDVVTPTAFGCGTSYFEAR